MAFLFASVVGFSGNDEQLVLMLPTAEKPTADDLQKLVTGIFLQTRMSRAKAVSRLCEGENRIEAVRIHAC